MDGRHFDELTKLHAVQGSRRQVVVALFALMVIGVAGSWARDRKGVFNRSSGLSCDACQELVGTAIDGGCGLLLSGRSICGSLPDWRCKVVSVGICLASRLLTVPGMDPQVYCASSMAEKVVGMFDGDHAPCPGPCGADQEACPRADGTHRCVPRCGRDRWLDPVTCTCIDEPEAITASNEKQVPSRSAGATGQEASKRWQFVVPEGQTLVVGARSATVNGMPFENQWVLSAYRDHTPMDMTIGFGFWALVGSALARSFFCGQLNPPAAVSDKALMHYDRAIGLDTWGPTACHDGIPAFSTMGNHYESPIYGYQMVWDDSWVLTMNNSWSVGDPDGGFDQIQLTNWASIVAITGTSEWGGHGLTCLDGVEGGLVSWPGNSGVFQTGAFAEDPLGILPGAESVAVYQYLYTWPDGSSHDRIAYVNCVTLPSGTGNMVVLVDAPIWEYEQEFRAARETLLASLVIVG